VKNPEQFLNLKTSWKNLTKTQKPGILLWKTQELIMMNLGRLQNRIGQLFIISVLTAQYEETQIYPKYKA